jgi:hypothetical protein
MRKRKMVQQYVPNLCRNCYVDANILINGLCAHCHSYLQDFRKHRPVLKQEKLESDLEYLQGIQIELTKMVKEVKSDADLRLLVSGALNATSLAADAVRTRLRSHRLADKAQARRGT